MRINKVDLNLFIAFEVIYREKNLTRAAEVLNISQPAVSNTLRRLREAFGDPLFTRSPHGMVPTALSHQLIGEVREALWRLNNTLVEREAFSPESASATFRLHMHDSTAALVFPTLVAKVRNCAPNVVLHTSTADCDVVQALSTAELDLSIQPPTLINPLLYQTPLISEDYVCVLHRDHPYAQRKLTLKRYLELFHVNVANQPTAPSDVDATLHALGKKRRIRAQVDTYWVAPRLAENSDLAVTLPRSLALRYDLAILPLPFSAPPLKLQLYWHKSVDGAMPNRWLRETVLGCFR